MVDLPLQLRAGLLFLGAVAGYALSIDILLGYSINLPGYFDEVLSPRRVSSEVWRAWRHLATVWVAGYVMSRFAATSFDGLLDIICWSTLIAIIVVLLRHARLRRVLGRVLLGGISVDYRLGDILVSDSLVSFAPVFVDIALAAAMTYGKQKATEIDRSMAGEVVLLAASLPIGIRIKQCFHDYRRTKNLQHLVNLGKYFVSNIPNALKIHALASPSAKQYLPIALGVSSIYSLAWDLKVDWALGKPNRVYYFDTKWYYLATIMDVLLRFSWLAARPNEHVVFTLEVLELFRRWVWIFFRVESEYVPKNDLPLQEL